MFTSPTCPQAFRLVTYPTHLPSASSSSDINSLPLASVAPDALLHMRKKYRCNKGPCYPKKYGTVFHENLTNWAITVSYWSTPIIVSSDSKSSKSDEIQRSHNSAPSESFHRPSSILDIGVPWSSQTLGGQHAFSPPFPLLPRRFYSPAEWGNPKLWPKQNNKKMQWEV